MERCNVGSLRIINISITITDLKCIALEHKVYPGTARTFRTFDLRYAAMHTETTHSGVSGEVFRLFDYYY